MPKSRFQVKFLVRCEQSDIDTVASGMLHSLVKDGWPNMLYTTEREIETEQPGIWVHAKDLGESEEEPSRDRKANPS